MKIPRNEEPFDPRQRGELPVEQEPYYDDWTPQEPTEEERQRYYEEKDRYYAARDRYYAERDRYYAQQNRLSAQREEYEPRYDGEYVDEYTEEPPLPAESDFDEEPGYRRELRAQRREEAAAPEKKKHRRRKKKNHFFRNLLLFLIAAVLVLLLIGKMPEDNPDGRERAKGRCTVLLAGTDREGYRTDTILLLGLDRANGDLGLLSIPRDTYVEGWYGVPKINSAFGAAGGGEAGMEELMNAVTGVVGFRPDGYMLVDLDAFIEAVDALGGVDFDVPMDMYYEDWDQDLLIDLRAGEQHLNGEQAMGLVRYRAGYANADIGRTEVQRNFIKSAMKQWLRPRSLTALPKLMKIYHSECMTDLSFRNLLWIFRTALTAKLSDMETGVLPGYSAMVGDASCYMADTWAAADFLNKLNPYIE